MRVPAAFDPFPPPFLEAANDMLFFPQADKICRRGQVFWGVRERGKAEGGRGKANFSATVALTQVTIFWLIADD